MHKNYSLKAVTFQIFLGYAPRPPQKGMPFATSSVEHLATLVCPTQQKVEWPISRDYQSEHFLNSIENLHLVAKVVVPWQK